MKKPRSDREIAEEIAKKLSEDTPENAAMEVQSLLQRAGDAGGGALRMDYLAKAQRALAKLDPARDPAMIQRFQAQMMALQGRRGDTKVAHVTPGEIVIPKRLQTPELLRALSVAAQANGMDPATLRIGSGRNSINPNTGQPEFADGVLMPDIEEIKIQGAPMPHMDLEQGREIGRRAQAVYGETAALRPQLINPAKSADNPKNWLPDSAQGLADARKELATMYGDVNDKMRPAVPPNPTNPIAEEQWRASVEAASASMNHTLDPRFTNMAMHQQGVGPQTIIKWPDNQIVESRGPFINPLKPTEEQLRNGHAIGAGPRAYIDFYGKKLK